MRLVILAAIFLFEKFLLHFVIDLDAAATRTGLADLVRDVQAQAFHLVVTGGVCLTLFSYVRARKTGVHVFEAPAPTGINVYWLIVHVALILAAAPFAFFLFRYSADEPVFATLAVLGACFIMAATLAAFRAMALWPTWWSVARKLGDLWIYAVLVAAGATWGMQWSQELWRPTSALTFRIVRLLLQPILPTLTTDPSALTLGTGRFSVVIAEGCSGLEGIGLMLAFCAGWLVVFRAEYRFPRSLVLIPLGLLMVFALNAIRIAALVLIGHAGYPDVAVYGFHTQAGWIAFTAAAGAVVLLSRRSRWMNRYADTGAVLGDVAVENPTAAYLMPLLVIMAAGMLSLAMSGRFETLYPLRLLAGATMLLYFRSSLTARLNWRFTWRAFVVGILTFVVWLLAAKIWLKPAGMPDALSTFSPTFRYGWIASRALMAIAIVPIAEELAFRGYLMRRLSSADFESVPFAAVRMPAIVLTSLAFGVNHGAMWAPGIVVGMLYGWLVCRTQRIGEAVAAHATTNALLTGLVLFGDQWQFW